MSEPSSPALARALGERRVVVCVGPGGVGKTTIAASLGLWGAWSGRNTALLTIDPARRLATALGLSSLSDEMRDITPSGAPGRLQAAILDVKTTFDRVIERYSPDPELSREIMEMPFYIEASTSLAGINDYMALERIYELHQEPYDLIVVDTPPAANALDFLDAPQKIIGVADNPMLRWIARYQGTPSSLAHRIFHRGSSYVLRTVSRITGVQLLRDLSTFLQSMDALMPGFRDRASFILDLLQGDTTAFVIVVSPDLLSVREALHLRSELERRSLPFRAFVVNRVRPSFGRADEGLLLEPPLKGLLDAPHLGASQRALRESTLLSLIDLVRQWGELADHDRDLIQLLEGVDSRTPAAAVPLLEEDIHSLEGLSLVKEHLFGGT